MPATQEKAERLKLIEQELASLERRHQEAIVTAQYRERDIVLARIEYAKRLKESGDKFHARHEYNKVLKYLNDLPLGDTLREKHLERVNAQYKKLYIAN